jgi:enoyl-CoA hydratase/carnithine racemase
VFAAWSSKSLASPHKTVRGPASTLSSYCAWRRQATSGTVLDEIRIRRADGILQITLHRPEKRNAMTGAMYGAFAEALELADADDDVRVVVVDAAGAHFSAGNDIAEFVGGSYDLSPGTPWRRFSDGLHRVHKPVVAGVQGYAVGIGLTMLLHFDLVYVDETARLSAPFGRLGLVPEVASSALLPLRIGELNANALFYLGKVLSASDAVRLGIANEVVAPGLAGQSAMEAARVVAALPRLSVEQTRALVKAPFISAADRVRSECEAFMRCVGSKDTLTILEGLASKRARS